MKVVGWKIWYTGGRIFTNKDGKFCAAPKDDVLMMMVYYEKKDGMGRPTRIAHSGSDWYFSDGRIFGSNNDSLEENNRRYPNSCFKKGKWSTSEEMDRVNKIAIEDYAT